MVNISELRNSLIIESHYISLILFIICRNKKGIDDDNDDDDNDDDGNDMKQASFFLIINFLSYGYGSQTF